ncbi:fungal-specific transcription factor domain-containing protein [Truncatella angustata]|uniref:Fungal-specific transcription factor domain-containing protein n=1 Tax=Truncatella angustata TaxID=152316 RepID=A0A9P8UBT4_9PEZI|nr:fungal-specific transcription factor domain-containing protein [Truncatella angustata]KAH6645320.1 fungal-specific transcription factor domain-containing protein [Truncatella angustata]
MDTPDVPAPTVKGRKIHPRISKACQECRRRKVKCDGASMCKNCEQISVACTYRSTTRNRKSAKRAAIAQSHQQPLSFIEGRRNVIDPRTSLHHQEELHLTEPQTRSEKIQTVEEDVSDLQSNTSQTHGDKYSTAGTNCSVSATHLTSAHCMLQLYYGASSNFSFLQQIHHSLSGPANPSRPRDEVEEGGAGLDFYGQRSLFFGTSDASYQLNGHAGISPLTLLSDQLAESFLEDYLNTIYHLHPFQSLSELRRLVKLLYENPQMRNLGTDETAILMAVLAIGATMTTNTLWAEMLAEKAKNIANTLGHVVNLKSVQLSLLLAHYESILGRPNSAYLYLGIAVRKAFAAGLHRDSPTYEANGRKHIQQQERRTTIWCLYFFESLICFALGRPSSIARHEISSPYPDNQPFISALVKLTHVMSEAAASIYAYQQSSLQDLYRKAQNIYRGLQDYALDVQERLGICLTKPSVPTELDVHHIFLQNLYYHTLALTFRPFLVADMDHQKSNVKSGNSSVSRNQSGRPSIESCLWVPEACNHAVDAAFKLIHFIFTAIEQNVMMRGVKFFAFYVEGACFLLIYDVLRDRSAKNRNVSAVKVGLQCLKTMVPGGGMITSNILSIQKLLDTLDEMPLSAAPRVNDSASAGLDQIPSLPDNFGFMTAAPNYVPSQYGAASYPLDTLVNFAAGWATFKDGHYMSQSIVPEPERFNPDLLGQNWEFDNVLNVPGTLF